MRNKQLFALFLAAAVAVQPQMVSASDSVEQAAETGSSAAVEEAEETQESTEVKAQAQTTESAEKETAQQETATETAQKEKQTKKETGIDQSAMKKEKAQTKSEKTAEKLATVRVTSKDVYGIAGGSAVLVGNYDQGYPAVPADGIVWCDGNKQPLTAGDKYSTPASTTMTLKNITKDQDGQTFYLSATNAAGTAYSEAVTLHVLDASAANQNAKSGSTAILSVKLDGNWGSSVKYQWYKGDKKISGATLPILMLTNVQKEDAGEYRCVVQRGSGSASEYNSKTVTANLTVDGKLAVVRVTTKDVYGIVGGKATLAGNYDQGYPSVPRDGVVWCDGEKNPLTDGDKYSTTTSTTMTLKNITKDQDGQTFYLSAANAAGTAYSEAVTLHVLDASAEDQKVQIGGTATLSVNLEGNWGSPVRYQWYKGDKKISGAVTAKLTLKDVKKDDAGEYKCVVQRGYGSASEYNSKTVTTNLTVDGKLAVVRVTTKDVYGIVGGKATLAGNYDQGYPSVPRDGVVWCDGEKNPLTDGDKYSTTTSTTMTLKNITKDQDGQTFYLSAANAAGTAYSEAVTLHVLDASAEDQKVQIGGTATLSVNLEGNWGSPVRYQWYKGDKKISGAVTAKLTLKDVKKDDAGEYKCVVQRGYGSASEYNSKTVTANLTVDGKLAVVRVNKTDVYGFAGGKVSLVGNYDQGIPAVPADGVVWCDGNKQPLTANDKYSTPDSTTMTLKNITADQDGQVFYLSAANAAGTAYSEAVTLHVLDASAEDQTVQAGGRVTLKVERQGDWGSDRVSYQWYKDGKKITNAVLSTYMISNADAADAGEYTCVVQRGYGSASEYNSKTVSAKVYVQGLPASITQSHENDKILPGDKVTFHAQLEKEWGTEVSWQWYDQDGNPISDNDTYSGAETDTLIVTADKAMDGKGYYCVISDDYRTAQTDVSNMIVEEETTDPEEPGQNPGGGTQTPENPGSGTETPENPGSGTQTPSNPGTGAETPGASQNGQTGNMSAAENAAGSQKEENTAVPKTGDMSDAGAWAALGGLGLLGFLEVLRRKLFRKE
ncbi:immunoglobulin domain-containing protein [Anaerostipes butyraticus]|uniref:immunoglobulin domain-containing protein n=1 Tax=Anaerostipes butyraticus TaxID=645466 RepID=UPI0023A85A72|nr:immunoglobulin domain-containing protein [Anaerostipes butyraticus]